MTKKPGIFSLPQISMISDINLPLSLMHLFPTYAVWFGEIIDGKIGLSSAAKVLEFIFVSILSKEIGLQFFMYLLYLSFLPKSFITACLCIYLGCLLFSLVSRTLWEHLLHLPKKIHKNSLDRRPFPGVLLLGILFRATRRLSSIISASQMFITDCR